MPHAQPLLLEVDSQRTGLCVSLIEPETKDRALAVVRGAADSMTTRFLQDSPQVKAVLLDPRLWLVYITAFVLTTPNRAACAFALADAATEQPAADNTTVLSAPALPPSQRKCTDAENVLPPPSKLPRHHGGSASEGGDHARRGRRAGFALNLSSAAMLPRVKAPLLALLPRCQFVFGNREELRALSRLLGEEEPEEEGRERTAAAVVASTVDCTVGWHISRTLARACTKRRP